MHLLQASGPADHTVSLPPPASLADLFSRIAERHAERTAVWVDGCAVSYRELSTLAQGIARPLITDADAGAARCCAILGARTLTAFAGVLGSILAGATYVPLNPRHPAARLAHVVDVAEAAALIVDARSLPLARELLGRVTRPMLVLLPDAASPPDWTTTLPQHRYLCRGELEQPGDPRPRHCGPEDGAYLLFTSGSTGAPKGVLIRHANVLSYLRAAEARYEPGPDDRFTQLFDLTFDLSVHDMFLCWGAGAALYCPPEAARMAPHEFVRRHDLTFWFSVPSTATWMQRLRILRPGLLPSLRWSLFCGEALPRRVAEAWAAAAPNSRLENLYGPTEATIAITAYRLPAEADAVARLPDIIPIGRPFPGQAAVVLNTAGVPAPMGEAGELCLGGSQVAGGYWRRPDLTADRFLSPIGADPGAGWYRTGDRARETAEHGLVFLGRMDRQVKINGHRVELQEVEAALRQTAACDCVAALAWPMDADGLARGIVAFVGRDDMPPDTILEASRQILPPYMMPSRIHLLSDWPVNDHGKADYQRLRQLLE